jgi:hypothetical protein
MKTNLYNILRNFAHVGMLFSYIYAIWFYCQAHEYTLDSKIVGMSLATVIISIVYGGFWEWCQGYFLGAAFDVKDIARGVVGGFLGYLFYLLNPNVEFIAKWCSLFFFALTLYSIYKGILLMKHRNQL